MNINLKIHPSQFCPIYYPHLLDYSHRWEFLMGSAGSGKSVYATQKIIIRCCREPINVVVCRRYGTTIRNSVFSLFKDILTKWQLLPYIKINESDYRIRFPNGSTIIFLGLDDEGKLLSLNNISTVWVEEAFEVPLNMVEQLNLRMRGKADNQQIILSWNPISKNHWLYEYSVVNPPANSIFIHSTYKDNPFLSQEYINSIEELKTRNPAKWLIYGLGEWGRDVDGLVFTNWETADFDPLTLSSSGLEHRAGADLGFIDPTTIVDTLYDRNNHKIYVFNEFYKSGQQLDQVADAIRAMNLDKVRLYMDSAEPRSISYFRSSGFNVVPSIKGKDSVKAGITFLQNHQIIVHPSCQNLIMELENFSYKKDKMGEYQDDCYTHEYSHAIDGLRYAYSDIYTKSKLKTLDKNVLGL